MRTAIAASLLIAASSAHSAGGAWDGIYTCGVVVAGQTSQVYVTVSGQPDGRAIFAVAAIASETPFYGYGIGAIAGSVFSGTTSFGQPFRVTANAQGFSGAVGVVLFSLPFTATVNCAKIW